MADSPGDPDKPVGLTVTLRPNERCPLRDRTGKIKATNRQIIDGQCRCQFRLREADGSVVEATGEHPANEQETCLCRLLTSHGVSPDFEKVQDGRVTVAVSVTDTERAKELIDDLERACSDLEIANYDYGGKVEAGGEPVTIDRGRLTPKQHQALELAIRRGYYCSPRQATLESLAAELDISRQAFTRRLTKAESVVFTQFVDADPCDNSE